MFTIYNKREKSNRKEYNNIDLLFYLQSCAIRGIIVQGSLELSIILYLQQSAQLFNTFTFVHISVSTEFEKSLR